MFLVFLFSCITSVSSQVPGWVPEPFNPPSLPLAVKSPYVNCWLPQGSESFRINNSWARNWDNLASDSSIMGWNAGIRVDGQAYNLFGAPDIANYTSANQTSVLFTPTRTSVLLTAGTVDVNMTFLSPIEAHDLTRLSMPFSYLYLSAVANDNSAHEIQFYSDITGDWIAGDDSLPGNWAPEELSDFLSLRMQLTYEGKYQEIRNIPQDAVLYHSIQKRSSLSWEINPAGSMRDAFANGTGLLNRTENNFHAVTSPTEGLGISVDIGSMEPGIGFDPVVFTIGLVRDPVVQYTNGNNQLEERNAYYWANFSTIDDVIKDALDHFEDALAASIELDNKLLAAANSISTEYAGLISLVTRQAMGAIEYTILKNNQNISDVKAFMKNMGNVGSGQVNAVDVIYAAMPVYLYLNPDIIGYLLSPLLDAQSSPQYTFNYAAIDLGGPFPSATGNLQGNNERVEQSANMIILSLAHAQASGNEELINQYYDLLSEWGDYLVNNTLSPTKQTTSSSDNIGSTNQTNLILKGIIGIRAMSEISSLTGHSDDFTKYKAKADQYYKFWENLAISDRIDLTYGGDSGLIYNLYADKLLGLNVVDDSVYALQTSFYKIYFSQQQYGVPLDTANFSLSRTDWMLFAATTTTDTQVRDNMIKQVYNYAASNLSDNPFSLVYNPSNGKMISGLNSPVQGAIFAPLALTVNKSINTSNFDPNSGGGTVKKHSSTGAIVGGVVGGVAAISISIACILLYRRRQHKKTASRFETGDMSQALRYRNHSNVIPTPFRVPGPLSNIIVQNPSPRNKTDKSGPASKKTSSLRPCVGETTDVERTNDTGGEALREEISGLRMEIERLREETAPPSYAS